MTAHDNLGTPFTRGVPVDHQTYHGAFESAMADNEYTHFVTHRSVSEMQGMTALMRPDKTAGVLIHDHGNGNVEATAMFRTPKAPPGTGGRLLDQAVREHGVNYVEAYGDNLRGLYEKHGFEVESSDPFNSEYAAPGWDYERHGRPNYYTMRHKGGR